jgi:VWFA-related protein
MGFFGQPVFVGGIPRWSTNFARVVRIAQFALLLVFVLPTQPTFAHKPRPAQSKGTDGQATIKTTVRQVLLDVVVTDGKNQTVTGLRREDFSILEDGKPQQILSFEAHSDAMTGPRPDGQLAQPKPLPNTFLNVPTPQDNLPMNVLLYDVLNTPIDDQPFARSEIVKFLRNRPRGARFAIFVLGDKLHLLQGFTDDEDLLESSLYRKQASTATTVLSPPPTNAPTLSESLSNSGALTEAQLEGVEAIDRMTRMANSYFLTRRVERTLNAFSEISNFLGGWSGRKNLIWLSGGFPARIFPGGDVLDPFATSENYSPETHEAVDQLTLNQVAVYPVDIRGLLVSPVFSAADPRSYRAQGSFAQALANSSLELAAEHTTMEELAEGSGGHAFYNTNGLAQAIAMAVENGANYYTLSYSPTNRNFNGRLRKIRVTLSRTGYSLSYRRSYFADDEKKFLEKAADTPFARVRGTMERGAPLAHEIIFKVHVKTEGAPAAVSPQQIDELSLFKAFASRKKWDDVHMQRYSLEYWIPEGQLQFAALADGTYRTKLEFLAGAYDAEGTPIYGKLFVSDETIPAGKLENLSRYTFHGLQRFDAPAQAAWLRLAVRDPEHNRVGAVEIGLPLRAEQ